jgi:hypothetical protein
LPDFVALKWTDAIVVVTTCSSPEKECSMPVIETKEGMYAQLIGPEDMGAL